MGLNVSEATPPPRTVESQPIGKSAAGVGDSLQQYRSPEKDAFPHPKNVEQSVWESRSIELNANAALHSKSGEDTAKGFQKIAETLKQMSPAERALMIKQLDTIGKAIDDTGKREPGVSSLPDVTIGRDARGKPTDITFKSISDDDAYGKSYKIDLAKDADKRTK